MHFGNAQEAYIEVMRHYTAWINYHNINRSCGYGCGCALRAYNGQRGQNLKINKKINYLFFFPPKQNRYYIDQRLTFFYFFYFFWHSFIFHAFPSVLQREQLLKDTMCVYRYKYRYMCVYVCIHMTQKLFTIVILLPIMVVLHSGLPQFMEVFSALPILTCTSLRASYLLDDGMIFFSSPFLS